MTIAAPKGSGDDMLLASVRNAADRISDAPPARLFRIAVLNAL
jgi:hypothetical protein